MFKSFRSTAISLIPKVPNPTIVKKYRPIACCTTMYKIITKILTNRHKSGVGSIVSPSQSTFIKGKSFMDNVLISHDILKWYTRRYMPSKCVINVDLQKACVSIK